MPTASDCKDNEEQSYKSESESLQSKSEKLSQQKEKIKHDGWGYDRQFTPLEQSLDEILEYMLAKELVKLPRVTNPSTIMGRFMDQFCKFHRAVGHDTDYCFVFKNIVQNYIDKNFFVENEKEYWSTISVKSQQKSSNRQKVQHDGRNKDRKMAPIGSNT